MSNGDWQAIRAARDNSKVAASARELAVLQLRGLRGQLGLRGKSVFIRGSWPVPGHGASVKMNSRQPGLRRRQVTVRVRC